MYSSRHLSVTVTLSFFGVYRREDPGGWEDLCLSFFGCGEVRVKTESYVFDSPSSLGLSVIFKESSVPDFRSIIKR